MLYDFSKRTFHVTPDLSRCRLVQRNTRYTLNTRILAACLSPREGQRNSHRRQKLGVESSFNFWFIRGSRSEFSGRRTRPGASLIEVRKVMPGGWMWFGGSWEGKRGHPSMAPLVEAAAASMRVGGPRWRRRLIPRRSIFTPETHRSASRAIISETAK